MSRRPGSPPLPPAFNPMQPLPRRRWLQRLCRLWPLLPAANTFAYAPASKGLSERVLLLGDSLTVGPFGDNLQNFLIDQYSDRGVGVIAVCGCSPEHWLGDEPVFSSRCGYRYKRPGDLRLGRYENGVPPKSFPVPKLESILRSWRPSVLLVQLGTNWFDRLAEDEKTLTSLEPILDRFASTVRNSLPLATLVWITPPDSSRFRRVQHGVTRLIKQAGIRHRFRVIDSSEMIRYESGKSGGDGVHLSTPAADLWAEKVKRKLRPLLGTPD